MLTYICKMVKTEGKNISKFGYLFISSRGTGNYFLWIPFCKNLKPLGSNKLKVEKLLNKINWVRY